MLVPSAKPGFGALPLTRVRRNCPGRLVGGQLLPVDLRASCLAKQPTDWLWRHYQAYARLCGGRQFVQLGDISREKIA
jgi:hypothetical protein